MLHQSYRLIRSRPTLLQQLTGHAKRRPFSTQTPKRNSDLILQALAGGSVIAGSTLIAYHYGYLNLGSFKSKQASHSSATSAETPATSEPILVRGLPESVTYLIVGGGTAAFSASRSIRSNDPKARVLIISAEEHYPYMRPPLSKELWYSGSDVKKQFTFKQWSGREKSIFFEHEEFYLPLEQD